MYWTDHCEDEIEVYDPTTLHRRKLITTGTNPFAIVVDPGTRYEPINYYCRGFMDSTGGFTGVIQDHEQLSVLQWMAATTQSFIILP